MSTPVISFCWDQIHFLVDQASNNSKFGFLDVQERSMIRSCFRIKTIYLKDFTWQWPQQWLFSVQVWLWWDWSAPRRWKVGVEEEEMRWKAMWWSTGSSWGKDRHTWLWCLLSLVNQWWKLTVCGSTTFYKVGSHFLSVSSGLLLSNGPYGHLRHPASPAEVVTFQLYKLS